MEPDEIADAVRRYVLAPTETVTGVGADGSVDTPQGGYRVEPADWLVAGQPWVAAAVRVRFLSGFDCVPGGGHAGLLLTDEATGYPLTDPVALRRLGGRVGRDLPPLAYSELIAEFHTSDAEPYPARLVGHPGTLIRDVDAFRSAEPSAAAIPVTPPRLGRTARGHLLHFYSYCWSAGPEWVSAIDVVQWAVAVEQDRPATWERHVTARRLERPPVPRPPEPRGPKRKAIRRGLR